MARHGLNRAGAARVLRFSFSILGFTPLLLAAAFTFGMPYPWRLLSLSGTAALAGVWVWMMLRRLTPTRYVFVTALWGFALTVGSTVWLFLNVPLHWMEADPTLASGLIGGQAAIYGMGALIGRTRFDVEGQAAELARHARPFSGGYRLRRRPPDWGGWYRRRFPAPLEWIFQASAWSLTATCLILAPFGGGAAEVTLVLVGGAVSPESAPVFGMLILSLPCLLGLGYLTPCIGMAIVAWRRQTAGLGREFWPEDV